MGLDTTAISGVGREFDNDSETTKWFLENFKGELSQRERETLEEDGFREFIESTRRKDLPKYECLNAYSGDGFALFYDFGTDIKKLRQAVDKALSNWEQNFKEEPELLNTVSLW